MAGQDTMAIYTGWSVLGCEARVCGIYFAVVACTLWSCVGGCMYGILPLDAACYLTRGADAKGSSNYFFHPRQSSAHILQKCCRNSADALQTFCRHSAGMLHPGGYKCSADFLQKGCSNCLLGGDKG